MHPLCLQILESSRHLFWVHAVPAFGRRAFQRYHLSYPSIAFKWPKIPWYIRGKSNGLLSWRASLLTHCLLVWVHASKSASANPKPLSADLWYLTPALIEFLILQGRKNYQVPYDKTNDDRHGIPQKPLEARQTFIKPDNHSPWSFHIKPSHNDQNWTSPCTNHPHLCKRLLSHSLEGCKKMQEVHIPVAAALDSPCHAKLLCTELSHVCHQVQASLDQGPGQPKAAKVTSSSMMQEG